VIKQYSSPREYIAHKRPPVVESNELKRANISKQISIAGL
jgi:hypothetical protein